MSCGERFHGRERRSGFFFWTMTGMNGRDACTSMARTTAGRQRDKLWQSHRGRTVWRSMRYAMGTIARRRLLACPCHSRSLGIGGRSDGAGGREDRGFQWQTGGRSSHTGAGCSAGGEDVRFWSSHSRSQPASMELTPKLLLVQINLDHIGERRHNAGCRHFSPAEPSLWPTRWWCSSFTRVRRTSMCCKALLCKGSFC